MVWEGGKTRKIGGGKKGKKGINPSTAWSSCIGISVKPLDNLPMGRLEFGSRSSFTRRREFPASPGISPKPIFSSPRPEANVSDRKVFVWFWFWMKNFGIVQRDQAGKGEKLCWACGKLRQDGWTCFAHSHMEFLRELGHTEVGRI